MRQQKSLTESVCVADKQRCAPRGTSLASGRASRGAPNGLPARTATDSRASVPDAPQYPHTLPWRSQDPDVQADPSSEPPIQHLSLRRGGPGNLAGVEPPPPRAQITQHKRQVLLTPRDEHLIEQQDEVDGKGQEKGEESQGVEVPREVVLR